MRIAAFVVLAAAGCGRTVAPTLTLEQPRAPAAIALPNPISTVVEMIAPAQPPAQAPRMACAPGALVDLSRVYETLAGSFSGPGLDEMIGAVDGDPEQNSFPGEALIRRTNGVWTMVRVIPIYPRTSLGSCQKLRLATGRELPICHRGSVSYGEMHDAIVAIDYTRPPEDEIVGLVAVADTTDTACTGRTELLIGSVVSVSLVDLNRDGNPDVRVVVRAAKIHVPPQPPCVDMGFAGAGQAPPHLPTPPPQTVDFIAQGEALTPTPGSARLLKAIAATMKQ
jgi:hypothetical protein